MYKQHIEGTLDEKLTQTQFGNGDINHDDVIDENDYIQVSDYVLGKVKRFITAVMNLLFIYYSSKESRSMPARRFFSSASSSAVRVTPLPILE